jgi:predicted acylesterase/phospholipase RssA
MDHDIMGWDDELPPEEDIKEILIPTLQDFKKSTCLILPSGGVKGIYLLGAIEYLYETVGFEHIDSYYGTSIGGIISGLLIIGYTPLELLVYICVQKIITCLTASFHIANILTEKQFLDSSLFSQLLQTIITTKIGHVPTLHELYTTYKKKLCVVTIARNNPTVPIYLSHETHPTLQLDKALQMTSSIPFVFGYTIHDDIEYIDGGLLDPFPILYASKHESRVFGINIIRNVEKKTDLLYDLISVLYVPILYIEKHQLQQLVRGTYIEIKTQGEFVTKHNKDIITMFISGYQQCKSILQIKPSLQKKKKD